MTYAETYEFIFAKDYWGIHNHPFCSRIDESHTANDKRIHLNLFYFNVQDFWFCCLCPTINACYCHFS